MFLTSWLCTNELFDTITGYRDVDTIQEQLKYESCAYSAINSLKKYLKNPDSYQPYEIIFYASMGTEEADIEKYPVCIMHYGAQNGFGGNTTSYAIFAYSTEKGEYDLLGSCDSLDEDDYDASDEDEFIRRVVPKGKSFDELMQADIDRMMDHINSYRRKKLNGKSPYEAFCFYYGEELAQRLGCHEVAANDINLTPGLLKK